jgi:hypothetical protein
VMFTKGARMRHHMACSHCTCMAYNTGSSKAARVWHAAAAAFSTLPSGGYWGCRSASMRSPLLDAPWTQKGWCPGSSWILTAVIYMFIKDCHVSNVLQGVEPAVHACRSETALGCTMWEAGWGGFACFTCFACCVFQYRYILYNTGSSKALL